MSPRKQKDSIKWMGGLGGLFSHFMEIFLGRSISSFQKMDLTPPTPPKVYNNYYTKAKTPYKLIYTFGGVKL
jgi:hypothetical protein